MGRKGRKNCVSPSFFFLVWGYVKDQVCSQRVNTMDVLKALITAALGYVTNDMLHSLWQGVDCR
jgi:hypothetical protein